MGEIFQKTLLTFNVPLKVWLCGTVAQWPMHWPGGKRVEHVYIVLLSYLVHMIEHMVIHSTVYTTLSSAVVCCCLRWLRWLPPMQHSTQAMSEATVATGRL